MNAKTKIYRPAPLLLNLVNSESMPNRFKPKVNLEDVKGNDYLIIEDLDATTLARMNGRSLDYYHLTFLYGCGFVEDVLIPRYKILTGNDYIEDSSKKYKRPKFKFQHPTSQKNTLFSVVKASHTDYPYVSERYQVGGERPTFTIPLRNTKPLSSIEIKNLPENEPVFVIDENFNNQIIFFENLKPESNSRKVSMLYRSEFTNKVKLFSGTVSNDLILNKGKECNIMNFSKIWQMRMYENV